MTTVVHSIFAMQCTILMTPLNFTSTSFLKHCISFTFEIIFNFLTDLNWPHVKPYAGKILNA